jgi:hypothetical protein
VQTLIEIDTRHCLMVSEPERLAHSPQTASASDWGSSTATSAGSGGGRVRAVRPARGTGSGGRPGRAPGRQTHPGHDSPGHLLTCVAPRFISGSVVLPGDATARWVHARRVGHVRCRLRTVAGHWPTERPVQVRRTIQCSGHRIVRNAGGVDPVARAARR